MSKIKKLTSKKLTSKKLTSKKLTSKKLTSKKLTSKKLTSKKSNNKELSFLKKNPQKSFSSKKRSISLSKELENARGPLLKVSPKIGLIIGFLVVLVALTELVINGDTGNYYILLSIGLFVIIPNAIWAKFEFTNPFVIPYILTMIRTKKFVKTINSIAHWGRIWEKICIFGSFLGFGLTGVDYWIARKKGGWKRIIILLISSIGLFFVLWLVSLLMLPRMPPLFEPLIGISIISFILLGFGGLSLAFMLGYGVLAINALIFGETICPSVAPVIPGVPIPGFGIVVPFIAWVSLAIILIIHEGSHGIMLIYYKKKLHSVGLLLAGLFPVGAFVEQDDKEFSNMDEKQRVCILSAGPSFNFLTVPITIIFVLILSMAFTPIINSEINQMYSGVKVSFVQETIEFCGDERVGPAFGKLFEGDIIVLVNETKINSLDELLPVLVDANYLEMNILRKGVEEKITIYPENFYALGISRIGVGFEAIRNDYEPFFGFEILSIIYNSKLIILNLLWILSLAVGMFNFLPSDPLDGGRIAKTILLPYFGFMNMNKKETEKLIGRLFAWLFLLAILLNLVPYLTLFLF
jgi:membrane-associated protease RseP (regulator of RpoE activity)